MTRKNLPRPPKNWREDALQAIRSFDPSIQAEAVRILRRRESETALLRMIEASNGAIRTGDFYHALRICSDCATPRRPPFPSRKRALEIASVIGTLLRSTEIASFLEKTGEGRIARGQLEKAKRFAEEFAGIPRGARRRFEQQDCFLRLYKLFLSIYKRPAMNAIRSWMKAAFPNTDWGEAFRDRPSASQ
ncbi:MAG TPA: hypothetical protein VH660_03640 [Candidatus Deferrimicrobiaceae bacterium]|jgi:hypothetical protein